VGQWGGPKIQADSTGEKWQLDVLTPQNDPFWQGTVTLYTLTEDLIAADLARLNAPTGYWYPSPEGSLTDALAKAKTSTPTAQAGASALLAMAATPLAWYRAEILFPKALGKRHRTVIAASQAGSTTTYRVLVDNLIPLYDNQSGLNWATSA